MTYDLDLSFSFNGIDASEVRALELDNPHIPADMEWAWACAVASSNHVIHQPPLLSLSFLDASSFEQWF
jgi:hypothetical protein